jgi:hypothetical protein
MLPVKSLAFHQPSIYRSNSIQDTNGCGNGDNKAYHRAQVLMCYIRRQQVFAGKGNTHKHRYRQQKNNYQAYRGRRTFRVIFHSLAPKKDV